MVFKVEYSVQAQADIAGLLAYYRRLNPFAAEKILKSFEDAADDLAHFPRLGREGVDGTREWSVARPFILIYEIEAHKKTLHILRVWHSSQER